MTTAALESVLAEAGIRVEGREFLRFVADAARRLTPPQATPADYFTAGQQKVLVDVGLDLAAEREHEPDPRARTVAARAVLADNALSVNEAAKRIGIDASRVRHRLAKGQLTGWKDRSWRLPSWQFTDSGVLPGLEALLAAIPNDQPALVVAAFMNTIQPDLLLDGEPTTPRMWMLAHGDPSPVAGLASTLGTAA